MVVLLWSKGLYRVTIGKKKEPTQNVEGINTPHEAWRQLDQQFGNEIN
jgi:hypothetical protein